jgi:hypothetical protein
MALFSKRMHSCAQRVSDTATLLEMVIFQQVPRRGHHAGFDGDLKDFWEKEFGF